MTLLFIVSVIILLEMNAKKRHAAKKQHQNGVTYP